jgi:hypothetical protein
LEFLKENITQQVLLSVGNVSEMSTVVRTKIKAKISPESAVNLRLPVLESKVDRILSLLEHPQEKPVINPDALREAILAQLRGDRGPIFALR